MLTAREMGQLIKLQVKQADYTPLTDDEIKDIEMRAATHHESLPANMQPIFDAWRILVNTLSSLSNDNLRLAADVMYWKAKA